MKKINWLKIINNEDFRFIFALVVVIGFMYIIGLRLPKYAIDKQKEIMSREYTEHDYDPKKLHVIITHSRTKHHIVDVSKVYSRKDKSGKLYLEINAEVLDDQK